MSFVRRFAQLKKSDTAIAGGKGASLGEMTRAGIPVPGGFVVLSEAFEQFIAETELAVEIDAELDKVNTEEMHTVEQASRAIRSLILNAKMPKNIEKEILISFENLNAEYVAVRSSATSEDSASAAWAGQLDSYLNTTESTLLENVKKCWASLFTPRAIFYRFEKNLHKTDISVAVVIQKMINSESSGIAFSVHPVTQDPNQLIIEAGFGLGEAIVSGQITPDSYVVDKQDWKILDVKVNEQTGGLFRKESGGNEWHELGEKGKQQVLAKNEIIELSKLIVKIENHYGFPCDIEWAREGGKFYIVQSRPITTLAQKEETKEKIIFDLWLSRPYPLLQVEAYNNFLSDISKEIDYSITRPVFVYNADHKLVTLYYNMKELLPGIGKIGGKISKDKQFREKIFIESLKVFEKVKNYFDGELTVNSLEEFEEFFWLFKDYMKYVAYTWVLPGLEFVPKEIRERAMAIRKKTEDYAGRRDSIMTDFANRIINDKRVDTSFLSLEEIKKRAKDIGKKSKERAKGFLFYKGEIVSADEISGFLESHNIVLKEPEPTNDSKFTGTIAQKGLVKGSVKIVYAEDELDKIRNGDILVTPMTRPEFVPVMKKAAAIITDEGGIVCHAAIVARELGRPCIIGTKFATKILHDGDLVEVDADNGIVRILEKNKTILQELVHLDCPLALVELHYEKEAEKKVPWAGEDFPFPPYIFYVRKNGVVYLYYDTQGIAWQMKHAGMYKDVKAAIKRIKSGFDKIKEILKKEKTLSKPEFLNFIKDVRGVWPWLNYMWWAIEEKEKRGEPIDDLISIRKYAEYFTPGLIAVIQNFIRKEFPNREKYTNVISLNEALSRNLPGDEILEKRLHSYAYTNCKLYDSWDAIINEYNIEIQKAPSSEKLSGQTAFPGKVRGNVHIIRNRGQLKDFKKGEILVASTTTLDFLPAMKKAGAIISEHGGAICHAAITSRELKISCIVGVRGVTHILKDGDLVEVDANNGIVRILKKK